MYSLKDQWFKGENEKRDIIEALKYLQQKENKSERKVDFWRKILVVYFMGSGENVDPEDQSLKSLVKQILWKHGIFKHSELRISTFLSISIFEGRKSFL